jgi:hypothetical protein
MYEARRRGVPGSYMFAAQLHGFDADPKLGGKKPNHAFVHGQVRPGALIRARRLSRDR